jgi:hypothetical protein
MTVTEKLREQLFEHLITERRVVYVLTLIRKLLETGKFPEQYVALSFYCDWALHTELSRAGAKRIINIFEDYYWPKPDSADREGSPELSGLVGGHKFRQQLADFLVERQLPNTICTDDVRWARFIQAYISTISGVPLVMKGQVGQASRINRVLVSYRPYTPAPDELKDGWNAEFVMEWRAFLKKGVSFPRGKFKGFDIVFTYSARGNSVTCTSSIERATKVCPLA